MSKNDSKSRRAVQYYVVNKLSMQQIADRMNISPSTVRYHLDRHNVARRTISDAVTNVYQTKFKKKPFHLKKSLSRNEQELKVAGVMLYWGEGGKSGGTVKFTNSDPEMIQVFLNFLRIICGIDETRLKALMHLYPDHDELKMKKFWSSLTGISVGRFYKSHIHTGRKGTYKKKSTYGTLALSYSDKQLLIQILDWIDDFKEKLS